MNGRTTASSILALACVMTLAGAASAAPTVSIIGTQSLPRLGPDGSPTAKRSPAMHPEGISARDCLDDQRIRVPLQLAGFAPQGLLEAWASRADVDCAAQSNRIGAAAACWRLTDAIPLEPVVSVDIRARRLVSGAVPFAKERPADDVQSCTVVDHTPLHVQFFYFAPGQLAAPTASASVFIDVDTMGDPPPRSPFVHPGDARVELRWGASETNRTAVNVYCARLRSESSGGPACDVPGLTEGKAPDEAAEAALRCGSVAGWNASGAVIGSTADGMPLENDVAYGFKIATVDGFGNVGPVSASLCEAPRAGAELPSEIGAEASGCSASPARVAASGGGAATTFGGALAIAALISAAARSRRRRRGPTTTSR